MRGVCNSFLSFSRSIASMRIIREITGKRSLEFEDVTQIMTFFAGMSAG